MTHAVRFTERRPAPVYPWGRASMLAANHTANAFLSDATPRAQRPKYDLNPEVVRNQPSKARFTPRQEQYERWWAASTSAELTEQDARYSADRHDPFDGTPHTRWAADAGGDVFAAYFPSPPQSDSAFAEWGSERGLQPCVLGCEASLAPDLLDAGCPTCLGHGFHVALDRRTQYQYTAGKRVPKSGTTLTSYRECECTLYPHDVPCRVCYGTGYVFAEASQDEPEYRSPRVTLTQLRDFAITQCSHLRPRTAPQAPVCHWWLAHNAPTMYANEQRRWADLLDHDLGTAYRATAGGERTVNLRIASADYVTCTTCHGSAKRRDGKPCFCNQWRTPPGTTPAHTKYVAALVNPDSGIYVSNMGEYIGPEWFKTEHPDVVGVLPHEVIDTLSDRKTKHHWPGNHVRLYYTEVYQPGPFVLRAEFDRLTPSLGPLGELFSHPGVRRPTPTDPFVEAGADTYDAPEDDDPLDESAAGPEH